MGAWEGTRAWDVQEPGRGQGSGSRRGKLDMGLGWDRSPGGYTSLGEDMSVGVGGVRSLEEDSSIRTWIWHGTGTREGARSWEGPGAWEGEGAWEDVRVWKG